MIPGTINFYVYEINFGKISNFMSYFNLMLNMRKLTNDYLVWTEGSSQEVQFFDYIKFTPVAVKIMGLFSEINYRGVTLRATVVIWTDLKSI